MAPIWLLLLLTPASCLLRTHEDPNSPIKNVRMDAARRMLTWDVTGNVSNIRCSVNSYSVTARNNRYCKFQALMRCEASNYTIDVSLSDGSVFSTWIQYPEQEGEPGSAAQHLDCRIHDVHLLTCDWQVGREAPRGVQYHLYLENVNTEQWWHCPQYTANGQGTHVQCRFSDVSGLTDKPHRFLVNGTSEGSTIRCSERVRLLSDIEKLSPPNMTASCNKSDSIIQWTMSSHFSNSFHYKLEIQKGTEAPYNEVLWETSFVLKSPRVYTARIAAVSGQDSSEWSAPQRFVCDHEEDARPHSWLIPSVAAVATLLTVGIAVLLCKWCSLRQKLFPPIPHMKNPLGEDSQNEKMMDWESRRAGQEECPVADVHVLGET